MTEDFMVSVPARMFAKILTERDGYRESHRLQEEERQELMQKIRELRKRPLREAALEPERLTEWFHTHLESNIRDGCPHYAFNRNTCHYLALKLLAEMGPKPAVPTEQGEVNGRDS